MSATSGYIAFPDDFLSGYNGESDGFVISGKDKYNFLLAAIATRKLGKLYLPYTGTFNASCFRSDVTSGYIVEVPGSSIIISPYTDGVEYGISINEV